MEIWKKINGFENYEISNFGRVKRNKSIVAYKNGLNCNHKERILIPENTNTNKKGLSYKRVTLSKNNITKRFLVHRLVALYFLENNENKLCVNHIDGNPSNNNILNLEWVTHSENEKHSYDVLGKINSNRKLKEFDLIDIMQNCIKGINHNDRGNVLDFMVKYKVDRSTILNVLNKKYYV